MAIGAIDFATSTGGKYDDPMRVFLIVLDEHVFILNASSLEDVNNFLKKEFPENIEKPFAIMELTNYQLKILDKPYIEKFVNDCRELFNTQ
ncbi:hypothetical protein [Bacillus inaquosorum]|uniref:hypothetical protein n=1 Tax=Bacillus inaquosorum TaxID=483913 RepID=UPI00227F8D58|nr:hypothetical protein [Bacillus inaquosorum]MCY8280004.1 hypothetical protein [Bacillus inaquosorum]MCY8723089.1 hypothetical protein [Bacillus inaquosorum]MEC0637284.1 hypothetical protein [Bacillus inaquosorum]